MSKSDAEGPSLYAHIELIHVLAKEHAGVVEESSNLMSTVVGDG